MEIDTISETGPGLELCLGWVQRLRLSTRWGPEQGERGTRSEMGTGTGRRIKRDSPCPVTDLEWTALFEPGRAPHCVWTGIKPRIAFSVTSRDRSPLTPHRDGILAVHLS